MSNEAPYSMLNPAPQTRFLRYEDEPPKPFGEGVNWTQKARLQFRPEPTDLDDITFDAIDPTSSEQSSTIHQFLYDASHEKVTKENYQEFIARVISSTRMTDEEIHRYIAGLFRGHMFDDELAAMNPDVREMLTKGLRVLA